jgi:pimeloyl-ACP methyl ester carboxylesterase
VAARFVFDALQYSPGKQLCRLSMPVLLQVAKNDRTTPASAALRCARGAHTVTLKTHDTDHFEPYVEPMFSTFIVEQLAFLKQTFR